ncbi:MAG: HD domain-containing protein [Rubrivivax sp.]|nr:HD domain-containing protein [Rubrivivax sp.]
MNIAPEHAPVEDTESNCFDPKAFGQMMRLVTDLRRLYQERNEALQEVSRAHHEALFRLALAAETRDDETGVHIVRMGFLAEALAREVGLGSDEAAMLRQAAPLHDVGKIGIPDGVLKKPGPLLAEERAVMDQHPQLGAGILGQSRIPLFRMAADVALTHHERWDGTGYPHRLSGEGIPLSGRLVAIVDFFDALTMDRCYRKAFSDETALGMLREQRGRAFDPRLVDVFLGATPRFIELRDRINTVQPRFTALQEGLPA